MYVLPTPIEILSVSLYIKSVLFRRYISLPDSYNSLFVKLNYAVLFFIVMVVIYYFANKAQISPWGRMMRAIRDNEVSANAMGKDIVKQHLIIFVIGASIVGVAGAMLVTLDGLFTPSGYLSLIHI